ncbi:MAG: MarR family winged helix-turn-helix transcriptional regulator [Proteobacteria bacterium]|nr:MarR family winged helix-turn-helix transcriptional regulator [Pseudomonadota bacterium]MDA1136377.1 MarR family winged helix-turn-helix transcriptional regulator [Pseudomonadota bacterium]
MGNKILCNCIALRQIALKLTKIYDEALIDTGIKVTQYSLLKNIEKIDTPNIKNLAIATQLDRSTLARNLEKLERMKLVFLKFGDDKRNKILSLTSHGKQILIKANIAWEIIQDKVSKNLGEDKKNIFDLTIKNINELKL